MKQIIPFVKDVVFKDKIAMITSISLEHEEKVIEGEVSGDFIIYGDYKVHNDTTEKELFKYRLPFTAILPDHIRKDSVVVDIKDFTYDLKEEDVLTVSIDFIIEAEEEEENIVVKDERSIPFEQEIEKEEDVNQIIEDFLPTMKELEEKDAVESDRNNIEVIDKESNNIEVRDEENIESETEEKEEISEYITYHIHIVSEGETIEHIIKKYETTLECIKTYNEIANLSVGDKLIIPDKTDE